MRVFEYHIKRNGTNTKWKVKAYTEGKEISWGHVYDLKLSRPYGWQYDDKGRFHLYSFADTIVPKYVQRITMVIGRGMFDGDSLDLIKLRVDGVE